MTLSDGTFYVDNATDSWGLSLGPSELKTHNEGNCRGRNCVIHNPSNHHMREWPLNWRDDRKIMERICPCGIGHPDPDDLAYQDSRGNFGVGIHGCCGHCRA